MRNPIKTIGFCQNASVILIAVTVLFGAWTIPVSAQADDCVKLRGTWNSANPETAGDLIGILVAENFVITKVSEDGTLHYAGEHLWITANGTLHAVFEGVLSPINETDYRANERNIIVGGTGDYEEATGRYFIQGIYNLGSGEGSGVYHGKLCLQD